MITIIGIDPGTTDVWFAIIRVNRHEREIITYGVIHTTPKINQSIKLLEIMTDLNNLLVKHKVTHAWVEKLYFTNNIKTGMDVSQSRWVILVTLANLWIHIDEFTPLQIKKALCWNGKANKWQVGQAVKILYKLNEVPKPDDAADALGIAFITALKYHNL